MLDSRDTQDCEEDSAVAQDEAATWLGLNDIFLQTSVEDGMGGCLVYQRFGLGVHGAPFAAPSAARSLLLRLAKSLFMNRIA